MIHKLILLSAIAIAGGAVSAQIETDAVAGAPGADAHWASAAKQGFGGANSLNSKVWFTLADGVLTEVYYPTLDVPNVQVLQFLVVTPEGKIETEIEDCIHSIRITDTTSLSFEQQNRAKSGAYVIYKQFVADPNRDSLLVRFSFRSSKGRAADYKLYVYYDPSLNNSGRHDSAWTEQDALLAADGDKVSALISSPAFGESTNGFLGINDGLIQLRQNRKLLRGANRVVDGNVVQVARLPRPKHGLGESSRFTLALGFGRNSAQAIENAHRSLARGFDAINREYKVGWHSYIATLPAVEAKYHQQFDMAAMTLRALEDKTYRGAFIASPSIPWGGGKNANEATISGYHAVWARDLYQIATAFFAMGDRASAQRALNYLFDVQQKDDGSFPQNSWIDGRPIGAGLQLDEVAFPLVLAYQLRRMDRVSWLRHIKPAADFIVEHGPATGQDRWEEKPGYSPSTIAAEIAGLVCAAAAARVNADAVSSDQYLKTADDWSRNLSRWTATTNGPFAEGNYYLRISEHGDPNKPSKIEINSGGGDFDQREIVDAGFLELVRLGIRNADDPLVLKSLAVIDSLIKSDTPFGSAWYRYNHDAYGERGDGAAYDGITGRGRLWTLLTGERGEYDVARGDLNLARQRLDTLLSFANEGREIPEQVWDRNQSPAPGLQFGRGTGSATPLAWSMAQFIRLAMNIRAGRNLETPAITSERYLLRGRHD